MASMHGRERSFALVAAIMTMLATASPLHARQIVFRLDSARTSIGFDADATLGTFHGAARRFSGRVTLADAAAPATASGSIVVQVASFETGNGMRDGHLRHDMDADDYPTITFELRAVDLEGVESAVAGAGVNDPPDAPLEHGAILRGDLTIHGETRAVGVPARFRVTSDSIRVVGRLPIRFTDFAMKPPSRLLGTVRVRNDLVLGFDAVFVHEGV